MTSNERALKLTTVGSGAVGKTCLLASTKNPFPSVFVPTVFDNYACNINVDGKDYNLTLWDMSGQEDYARLRPLSYPDTDCFLLCYSISNRKSFEDIFSKWYPEIRHFSQNVPIVLIGLKSDLRSEGSEDCVTTLEGEILQKKIKAVAFVECSTTKNENVINVFEEATRAAENHEETHSKKKSMFQKYFKDKFTCGISSVKQE